MLSDMDEIPFVKLGEDDVLRFELDPLTSFGKEIALKELRETPENKTQALAELKTLLQGKPPLCLCRILGKGSKWTKSLTGISLNAFTFQSISK